MRVLVDGDTYELDLDRLTIKECRELKRQSGGMTIEQFTGGLAKSDPDSVAALVWLAKRRNGEVIRFDDVDFVLDSFSIEFEEEVEEASAEAPALPTPGDDSP